MILISKMISANNPQLKIKIIINEKVKETTINLDIIENFIIRKYIEFKKYFTKDKRKYIN